MKEKHVSLSLLPVYCQDQCLYLGIMLETFYSLSPALGWCLLPSPGGKKWACCEEAGQQEELESHRNNSGGVGGEKARHWQGWRQQAGSCRDPESASGTHQSKQWQCPAGRQHGCKQVHAGECGSAAKCFYREVFNTLWSWDLARGRVKSSSKYRQHLCRPISFMSPLLVFKSFRCQVKTSELSLSADTQTQMGIFLQSTSRITTF